MQDTKYWKQNTGFHCKIQDTKYRIHDTAYRIQVTRYRIRDTGYRIQDTGYRIQDTGYRIQDTGYWIQDTGYGTGTWLLENAGIVIQMITFTSVVFIKYVKITQN